MSVADSSRQASAEGGRASVHLRAQLGSPEASEQSQGWRFTAWPECAEASLVWLAQPAGTFRPAKRTWVRVPSSEDGVSVRSDDVDWWVSDQGELVADSRHHGIGFGEHPEHGLENRADVAWMQANGRAAAKSRRYFVRNRLRYMWVLTFEESHTDRRQVMALVSDLARKLRRALRGTAFPYWYSPELHPGGHGWHVNLFVPMRIPHAVVRDTWGNGHVWVTDFGRDPRGPRGEPLGLCREPRDGWRRAAQYGCKYSQKDWSPDHVGRLNHRYEVAQHFAPRKESIWVQDPVEAEVRVLELVEPGASSTVLRWSSNDSEDWDRPPVMTWRW